MKTMRALRNPWRAFKRHRVKGRWVAAAVLLVSLLVLARSLPLEEPIRAFKSWIEDRGFWGPVVFGAVYVVATVLLIPGSALTLLAGGVFGLLAGTVVVSLASTTAATVAFLIGRHSARDRVEHAVEGRPKFQAVDDAIGEEGFKIVLLLRLSPALPFTLSNYFYGITSVKLTSYIAASWLGMLPGTVMYVYLGHVGARSIFGGGSMAVTEWILLGVGAVATVVVTVLITKRARQAIQERTELDPEEQNEKEAAGREGEVEGFPWMATALAAGALVAAALAVITAL